MDGDMSAAYDVPFVRLSHVYVNFDKSVAVIATPVRL